MFALPEAVRAATSGVPISEPYVTGYVAGYNGWRPLGPFCTHAEFLAGYSSGEFDHERDIKVASCL